MYRNNVKNIKKLNSYDMYIKVLTLEDHFNSNIGVEYVTLPKGSIHEKHYHKNSDAFIYIICGDGFVIGQGDAKYPYKSGEIFYFEKGTYHGFIVESITQFISIQSPPIINHKDNTEDLHF